MALNPTAMVRGSAWMSAAVKFIVILNVVVQIKTDARAQSSSKEPMFISRSETFKFVAGETIQLPCQVSNTENYIVAWKRGIAILSAGTVKVTPDPRVRLVNGFSLQIRDAVPQDGGDYICQIATLNPREITHTVEILVPPKINHISSGPHLQVKKGASVRIECSASGNPSPNITWTRKNNVLPNGEERLFSPILSIENMDRHKSGIYICQARNGVGQPASSQVALHVLYPPEISVETPVVYSGEGEEAMLVCIVHGEAQPEVTWFKETMQLDTTERHIMENRGSRHMLIIRKVHLQDFGNYSCVAENPLGKTRQTLALSGKPNTAIFRSAPISQYKDRYNISWTVDSHSPVEEFKLFFRRVPQGHEIDNSIEQSQPLQHQGVIYTQRGYTGHHWPPRSDWRDVVLPAIPLSHHFTQGMSYMIRNLDPNQHYEAKVQARNRYGWSDLSESFEFSTSMNGECSLAEVPCVTDTKSPRTPPDGPLWRVSN
ncbi:limbic system-associated membrane protein-like isoform X2 [Phlebotomus argentipes]|uniref:limbic system-associated membrane protein-like isoform X2 n=1 Tax=Phlebotomus argentipes TaxID=94469 RepID=UPI00289299EA|nr:limbic system-associated membrane protein-like isoform X2 [Phlebotomus argentipes]